MAVEWRARELVYFPIPKVACTTLKHVFYLLNNGRAFAEPTGGTGRDVHLDYAGTPEFRLNRLPQYADWRRLVVIRDPVQRFLSAYVSRVIDLGELSDTFIGDAAAKLNVPVNPDIHQFIRHFDIYRGISRPIRHHFEPQAYFVGPNLSAYTDVYRMEELEQLHQMLMREHGCYFDLPRYQRGSANIDIDEISVRELGCIQGWYAGDYALLSGHYHADDALPRRTSRRQSCSGTRPTTTMRDILCPLEMVINGTEQVGDDTTIYVEGCSRGVVIRHADTLNITGQDDACLVSFEKTAPDFLVLGESYEIVLRATSANAVVVTCFVRYGSGEGARFFGTARMALEPGRSTCNVLLDTEVTAAILGNEPFQASELKFILMFDAASTMQIDVTEFGLRLAAL